MGLFSVFGTSERRRGGAPTPAALPLATAEASLTPKLGFSPPQRRRCAGTVAGAAIDAAEKESQAEKEEKETGVRPWCFAAAADLNNEDTDLPAVEVAELTRRMAPADITGGVLSS